MSEKPRKYKSEIIDRIRKRTTLKTRLKVLNQMGFIDLITELGYREEKMWTDEEDPLLQKLCDLADIHTDRCLKNVKEWKDDGSPKEKIFTEDQVLKLLDECWEAADDYRDQIERIASGRSNFDKPTLPDKEEWIKENLN